MNITARQSGFGRAIVGIGEMAAIVQLTMSDIVKRIGTTDFLEAAAEYLETHGYTVIPPKGPRA